MSNRSKEDYKDEKSELKKRIKDQGYTIGYALFDKQTRKGGYYLYSYDNEINQLPFYYIIGEYKSTFIGSISAGNLMRLENIKDPAIGKIIDSLKEDDNSLFTCFLVHLSTNKLSTCET